MHISSPVLMKYRQEADDNPSYIFTDEDYHDLKADGEQLCSTILQHLKEQGYLQVTTMN